MKLLITVTLLYSDYLKFGGQLNDSVIAFKSVFGDGCDFLFVVQFDNYEDVDLFKPIDGTFFYLVEYCNVSRARNSGIKYAKANKYSHILFHDCSLIYDFSAVNFLKDNLKNNLTLKLRLIFDDFNCSDLSTFDSSGSVGKVNVIYDTCVGTYLFSVKDINCFFDEEIGPGKETMYKSGEDVSFLTEYFSKTSGIFVYCSDFGKVYHPRRPLDNSKELLYAKGQGRLYRYLLRNRFSLRLLFDFSLFVGNAFFKVFTLRKNSISIFINRFKGLFDL
ncbi:hypothetical protein [Vibrio rotiferianus]|uniref:hypothetical protein n=1 Tax=Vibrio rotiferianus TaxID=190895 RepID=UPI00397FD5D4